MTVKFIPARKAHRRAIALVLAAVAFPPTAFAQDAVTPPVIVVPAVPAPVAPPAAPVTAAESRTVIAPGVVEQAEQEARDRAAAERAVRPTRSAPVVRRQVARTGTAAAAAAPAAVPLATSAPPAAMPPAAEAPQQVAPAQSAQPAQAEARPAVRGGNSWWLILAGLGAIAVAVAASLLLRRRRTEDAREEYREPAQEVTVGQFPIDHAPVPVDEPNAGVPLFMDRSGTPRHEAEVRAALEHATLTSPDREDIDAVLGGATPHGDRPQLELAMRPIRAGVNRDEGVVEFELTVANAGGVEAHGVRIGAFMVSGEGGESTDIERLLIDPPADGVVDAYVIAPGDGKRLDAAVILPRDNLRGGHEGHVDDGFTPIVLADVRYRLPNGGEGRTAAAFAIGRVDDGDALVPIGLGEPAMYADIEARLFSVAAKT